MSLLQLNRRNPYPSSLEFHKQELKVIDHNGQPWFTAETIGTALGLVNPRKAAQKIYDRYKDEFGSDETTIIEMEIEVGSSDYHRQIDGGSLEKTDDYRPQNGDGSQAKLAKHTRKIQVRIFSLRGAYHFGFFARTTLGKQFRQWVLDLIEARHEESSYYAAFRDVVGVLSDKYPLWQQVHFKFTIGIPLVLIASELDVPVSRVSRAIRQMRHYKVLTEKDYQRYRAEGRDYLKIIRRIKGQGGVL